MDKEFIECTEEEWQIIVAAAKAYALLFGKSLETFVKERVKTA